MGSGTELEGPTPGNLDWGRHLQGHLGATKHPLNSEASPGSAGLLGGPTGMPKRARILGMPGHQGGQGGWADKMGYHRVPALSEVKQGSDLTGNRKPGGFQQVESRDCVAGARRRLKLPTQLGPFSTAPSCSLKHLPQGRRPSSVRGSGRP